MKLTAFTLGGRSFRMYRYSRDCGEIRSAWYLDGNKVQPSDFWKAFTKARGKRQ